MSDGQEPSAVDVSITVVWPSGVVLREMASEPGGQTGNRGWADLGFTTASDGVVIHGPASKGFAGQLMLTQDGGLIWRQVSF